MSLALNGDVYSIEAGELNFRLRSLPMPPPPSPNERAFIFWPYRWEKERIENLKSQCADFFTPVCGDPDNEWVLLKHLRSLTHHKIAADGFELNWFAPRTWQQLLVASHSAAAYTTIVVAGSGPGLAWEIALLQTVGHEGPAIYLFPKGIDRRQAIQSLVDFGRLRQEHDRFLYGVLNEEIGTQEPETIPFLEDLFFPGEYGQYDLQNRLQSLAAEAFVSKQISPRTGAALQSILESSAAFDGFLAQAFDSLAAAVFISGHLVLITGELSPQLTSDVMCLQRQCLVRADLLKELRLDQVVSGCGVSWILRHLEGSFDGKHILWYAIHSLWSSDVHAEVVCDGAAVLPYQKKDWRQLDALVPRPTVTLGSFLKQHGPDTIRKVPSFAASSLIADWVAPSPEFRAHVGLTVQRLRRRLSLSNNATKELTPVQTFLFDVLEQYLLRSRYV